MMSNVPATQDRVLRRRDRALLVQLSLEYLDLLFEEKNLLPILVSRFAYFANLCVFLFDFGFRFDVSLLHCIEFLLEVGFLLISLGP